MEDANRVRVFERRLGVRLSFVSLRELELFVLVEKILLALGSVEVGAAGGVVDLGLFFVFEIG